MAGACGSELSWKPGGWAGGLLLLWPQGPGGGRGGQGTGSKGCAAASSSLDGALNGFVLPAKRSVPGKVGANGFGEQRTFSWDWLRTGSGGSVGMQLTELKMLMLLDVAGGRGTTPLGPGVRTGAGCTGGWACDMASRRSDRSSNGSLFDGDSSLTAGTPLGLTCYPDGRSCCAEGSEGRLWEDLLRGRGWGGVSKPGWGAA